MLKDEAGEFFILDWLRSRNTLESLGVCKSVFSPNFISTGSFLCYCTHSVVELGVSLPGRYP
jgi:hypothetical protein